MENTKVQPWVKIEKRIINSPALKPLEKLVLITLLSLENSVNEGDWFSIDRISLAKMIGMDKDALSRSLTKLEEMGLIEKTSYRTGVKKTPLKFHILRENFSQMTVNPVISEVSYTKNGTSNNLDDGNPVIYSELDDCKSSQLNIENTQMTGKTPVSRLENQLSQMTVNPVSYKEDKKENIKEEYINNKYINKDQNIGPENNIKENIDNIENKELYNNDEIEEMNEGNIKDILSVLKSFKFDNNCSNIYDSLKQLPVNKRKEFENIYKELLKEFNYVYSNFYNVQQVAV